jgi:hypothetical protein
MIPKNFKISYDNIELIYIQYKKYYFYIDSILLISSIIVNKKSLKKIKKNNQKIENIFFLKLKLTLFIIEK